MSNIDRLLAVVARLRDPEHGCPWDRRQSFETIARYTIEEAYEVVDAIDRGDTAQLADELGDLLFQVVFHAQIAEETGLFGFDSVVEAIIDKLIRRHPHVFGSAVIDSIEAQSEAWEAHKAKERAARRSEEPNSLLDDLTRGLPAISRALRLQQQAATVAFDWSNPRQVIETLREELNEAEAAVVAGAAKDALTHELGDLIFTCINLARHLDVDPEAALRGANQRFERRFRRMETLLGEGGGTLQDSTVEELDRFWERAKQEGL